MSRIMMLMVQDGLQLPSGFLAQAEYRCLIYCRVPDDWVSGAIPKSPDIWLKGFVLGEDKLEEVYQALYGAAWREGNEDGSHYVVLSTGIRLLNPDHQVDQPWEMDDLADQRFRYFYFAVNENGNLEAVERERL